MMIDKVKKCNFTVRPILKITIKATVLKVYFVEYLINLSEPFSIQIDILFN